MKCKKCEQTNKDGYFIYPDLVICEDCYDQD